MKFVDCVTTLLEVPKEVSLAFTISGCQLKCKGCHSSYLWNRENGKELTEEVLSLPFSPFHRS